MRQGNERKCHNPGSEESKSITRRQFLKFTGAAIAAGITIGVGGIPETAIAGGFDEYLK